ncbi:MAG: SDR family NAD(P)-dependent oxidoreductase [Acidobacteriia bacterium]|nr:SDR family NAD(P)-dependent oxidoreductase [Terriglobia bacterium]
MPATNVVQNPVAVITGGGSGIGLAMARIFAASGYSVVITGRDAKRLQKAAATISEKKQVAGIPCDVRNPASVEKLFREIGKQHSVIDVLINNAGVAHALAPVDQLSIETWKEVIDTNLTGTFLVTRAALPLMRAGGTIVNNLSVAALQPFAGMAAYNASKFGALGFTHALREDLHKRGIRVLALLPGATDTDIWSQFWPDAPKEKMISAETVAQAVLHAVSAPANTAIEEIRIGPAAGVL